MTRVKLPVQSEAQIKRAVQDLLKARGIISFRMNAGDRFGSYKGKTWRIMGNPAGTADLLFFWTNSEHKIGMGKCPYKDYPVWVELKSDSGKQSKEQEQFQHAVRMEAHTYLLIRSASELNDWLNKNA